MGPSLARNSAGEPATFAGGVLTLRLHVQPGAGRTAWAGLHGGALKLRLAAPAVDGKANAACVAFLADAAQVPRRAVEITHGLRSRDKVARLKGVSPERFRWLSTQWSR